MKKLFVSLLIIISLLISACGGEAELPVSSLPEEDISDVSDISDVFQSPETELSLFKRNIYVSLPEDVTYSLDVRKDYDEVFSEYFDLATEENVICYVWTQSGELKFGLSRISAVSDYNTIISSLNPATLGEIRAVLSRRYSLESRKKLSAVALDDSLLEYTSAFDYMLGIGEYCIEFTVSLENYNFDIPFYGKEATELYNLFNETRKNAETVPWGTESNYAGGDISVGISFAAAGTADFGGIAEYGNYSLRPDGYMSYMQSMWSSTFYRYMTNETFYRQIYDRVIGLLDEKGIKYPFAEPDETWCSVLAGLHSNKMIFTGEKAAEILELAQKLSDSAGEPTEDFVPEEDSETAVYIEFYNGNMDIESEFVVYRDEYCGILTPLDVSNRPRGILPDGSYDLILDVISDEYSRFECNISMGVTSGEYVTVTGSLAKELFVLMSNAKAESREANDKEMFEHKYTNDSSAHPQLNTDKIIHLTFTLPDNYPGTKGMIMPWFNIWQDNYAQWSPSSMMSYIPPAVILPDGTYDKVYKLTESVFADMDKQKSVEEFIALAAENGIKIENPATVYNVTPESVKNATDYRIFKVMTEFRSYLVFENEIYEICNSFGGFGFHDARPWDYDKNGVTDLLVLSSWGSGMHREEISYFDMTEKRSQVLFSSLNLPSEYYGYALTLNSETNEKGNTRFVVKAFEPSPISSRFPESVTVGEVILQNGEPLFVLNEETE